MKNIPTDNSESFPTVADKTPSIGNKTPASKSNLGAGTGPRRGVRSGPTLNNLSLASTSVVENSSTGTLVGAVLGKTVGSTLTLIDSAGNRFALSGTNINVGSVLTDFETAVSHTIILQEALLGYSNSPRNTLITINVSNVNETASLSALTLSTSSIVQGSSTTVNIVGATPLSSITASSLPAGMVLDSSARTISGTPTVATTYNFSLTETLADSANSPRVSNVSVTVSATSYAYTISSDADWATIPAGLLTGGGLIGVAPGTYSAKTITATPSAPLIFRAISRATEWNATKLEWDAAPIENRARVQSIALSGTSNIVLDGLELVTSSWAAPASSVIPALSLVGTNAGFTVTRCYMHSGYRGQVDTPHDPNFVYPEFASIIPQFSATGQLTGFVESGNAYRPYVGNLMADGTYSMTFNSIGGIGTFTTQPVANFTVSGGYITATTIDTTAPLNGVGASNINGTAVNGSFGALSKVVTWAGQQPMSVYLAFGIKDGSSANNTGAMTVTDCLFEDLSNAVKGGVPKTGGAVSITGNTFRRIYMDYISVGLNGNTVPPNTTIAWNVGTQPFSRIGDAGDPHSDFVQAFMNDLVLPYTPSNWSFEIYGNVHFDGNARGGVQGILLADCPAGIAYTGRVTGNIIASSSLANGIVLERASEAYLSRNTVVRFDPTNDVINTNAAAMRFDDALPWNMLGNNIFEGIILAGNAPTNMDQVFLTNTTLGRNGVTLAYSNVFNQGTTPATLAQVISYFTPKGAYTEKGIGVDGYLDFANRIIDRTKEPVFAKMPIKINQATSTNISSAYTRILGGPNTGTVTLSNGAATLSNSSLGAGESASSNSLSYTRGQYLKAILPSSSLGSSATTLNATFNGIAFNRFDVITSVVSTFPIADNQGTAYSRINSPPADGINYSKLLLGIRCRQDVSGTGNILADSTGAAFRLYEASETSLRFTVAGTGSSLIRVPIDSGDFTMHTYLISVDFTKTDVADGAKGVIDSVVKTLTGSTMNSLGGTRTFTPFNLFSTGGLGVFAAANGSGTFYDGDLEWLWINWVEAATPLPDITDPFVSAAFSADRFAADGSSSVFSAPKLFYRADTLADYNSTTTGIPNRGTISSLPLVKIAGTYV